MKMGMGRMIRGGREGPTPSPRATDLSSIAQRATGDAEIRRGPRDSAGHTEFLRPLSPLFLSSVNSGRSRTGGRVVNPVVAPVKRDVFMRLSG